MELILLPDQHASTPNLEEIYHRALSQSKELYIVSAYLTEWGIKEELGSQCESFLFIVGKDFGITRKKACRAVCEWLPAKRRKQFMVAESISGFHPKAIFWKEQDGKCYALLGSSNLTKAAFSTNREANGFSRITQKQFAQASEWVYEIFSASVTLDEVWLEKYREAVQPPRPAKSGSQPAERPDESFELSLPPVRNLRGVTGTLEQRRTQMRFFRRSKAALEEHFRKTSRAQYWSDDRNEAFYAKFSTLWFFGDNGCRFQGKGWERKGRYSNYQEFSKSLVRVLDTSVASRDEVVVEEINRLTELCLPTRGALFSEMLCQFFPRYYHVLNRPVNSWLTSTNVMYPRGTSKGDRYVDSARLLRAALKRATDYPADNLAELDCIIWLSNNQEKVDWD